MSTLQSLLKDRNRKKDAEMGNRTGITAERIEELSKGVEPNLEELRLLAEFFRTDLRDLLPLNPEHQSYGFLFRTMGDAVDEITSSTLSRRIGYSMDLLDLSHVTRPWWLDEFSRGHLNYEDAEANAEKFRKLFFNDDQVSPFLRLPELAAEALGILLFLIRTARFEGASAYVDGLPFVFVAERFGPRMLFTLAHEIGHLIAHHDPNQGFAVVDVHTERRPQAAKNAIEFYAHAFASCLLMPRQGIGIALRKIRQMEQEPNRQLGDLELLLLARIYSVSFYSAAKRCEDLDLLPRGGAASLDQSLHKEYGSPEKRAEIANLPPRPQIQFPKMPSGLLKAALAKVRSGELSVGRASSILGLSIADLFAANAPRTN
jgi:Zn-dependent peptidase ImmA (M78 family)